MRHFDVDVDKSCDPGVVRRRILSPASACQTIIDSVNFL